MCPISAGGIPNRNHRKQLGASAGSEPLRKVGREGKKVLAEAGRKLEKFGNGKEVLGEGKGKAGSSAAGVVRKEEGLTVILIFLALPEMVGVS